MIVPRQILVLDYETYWDSKAGYSLAKMTNEAYVTDPRFQAHGACVLLLDARTLEPLGPARFLEELKLVPFLHGLDWSVTGVAGHNLNFDASILAWRYGLVAAQYFDTLAMANVLVKPFVGNAKLDTCAKAHDLPVKSGALAKTDGLRTEQIQAVPGLWDAFSAYAIQDGEVTAELLRHWLKLFPPRELVLMDWAVRSYACPKLRLDRAKLQEHLEQVQAERDAHLKTVGLDASVLRSTDKFAQALAAMGVKVEHKPGKNGEIPALAKDDAFMRSLLKAERPAIRAMAHARLAWASNLEVTRSQRLLDMAACLDGYIAFPLAYCSARTGRWGGAGGVNGMNLSKAGGIRPAIMAPLGHRLVIADLAQIEARIVAWLAGCTQLVEGFRAGRDVYCEFASVAYGRTITKEDKTERFVGKTCLAAGTLVLTNAGWLPIEQVKLYHKVWDGEEWVCHQGLINQSERKTVPLCGVWLTPEHGIWCGDGMYSAATLLSAPSLLSAALASGKACLPSPAGCWGNGCFVLRILSNVHANEMNTLSANMISIRKIFYHATNVKLYVLWLKRMLGLKTTTMLCLIHNKESAYLKGLMVFCKDVTTQTILTIKAMAQEVSKFAKNGRLTDLLSFFMFKLFQVGTIQHLKPIVSTLTATTNPATFVSLPVPITYKTCDSFPTTKPVYVSWRSRPICCEKSLPVYDLANAGPRRRFTILTDAGPMLVSNCTLGLGYGLGGPKLADRLTIGGVPTETETGVQLVRVFRQTYPEIPWLWRDLERTLLDAVQTGEAQTFKSCVFHPDKITLPSGRDIFFPELREGVGGLEFWDARWKSWTRVWGGMLLENLCQSMARDILSDVHAELAHDTVLQVHDELVLTVPEGIAEAMHAHVQERLGQPPAWAEDLPVQAEVVLAERYQK